MKKSAQQIIYFNLLIILLIILGCNNVVRVNEKEQIKLTKSDLAEPENYKEIETCKEGKELAKKDIEKGQLKYIFGSFGSKQELPKKLNKLYNIEIIKTNGLLGIPNDCYNDIMYQEIQKRFGKDAFNKALEE